MILTYDLSRSPPTYDFVGFLMTAEMERLKAGADHIDIRFKPGPVGGFRRDSLPPDLPERQRMFDNIVWPMARMMPSVRTVLVHDDNLAPGDMTIGHGTHLILRALRAGVRPLRAKCDLFAYEGWPYVTITLREADYWPERNSNLKEWVALSEWIEKQFDVEVKFIRDAAIANSREGIPPKMSTLPSSSTNLDHRASAYQNARLNLFTNNGPAWFCAALNAPTFIWRMVAPSPATTEQFFARVGMPVGSQVPGVTICWGDDPYPQLKEVLSNGNTHATND